jgi:hypothetical protein
LEKNKGIKICKEDAMIALKEKGYEETQINELLKYIE